MSEVPGLKLIQAVDPTKIKVTINEKLSKLTLSSNKKKKKEIQDENEMLTVDIEKRRSASRNLMDEMLGAECDAPNDNGKNALCINAILRSSSLSSEKNGSTKRNESLTQIYDVKVDDTSRDADSMERLQLSDDFTLERPVCDDETKLNEMTQKLSLSVGKGKVAYQEKRNLNSTVVIDIVSSSEDEDEEEESVISISDTSEESIVKDCFNDYNIMAVSDVQTSVGTDVIQLPCTLSNENADRIEAFLRDVSLEQRYMQASGRLTDDSLLPHLIPSIANETEKNNALLDSVKAKIIATADTESMSRVETESDTNAILKPTKERNMAFDDTEAMSESAHITLLHREESVLRKSAGQTDKRFAYDDTEINSINNTFEELQDIEDSITIAETSSDDRNSTQDATVDSSVEKQELVPSEDVISSSQDINGTESPHISLSVGSINISAKINIRLQIHAQCSTSEDGCVDSDDIDDSDDDNGEQSKSASPIKSLTIEATPNKNLKSLDTPKHGTIDAQDDIAQSDEHFLSHAQKLLTELYGNSWKTPDVVRTLQRTCASAQSIKLSENSKNKSREDSSIQNNTNVSIRGYKQEDDSVLKDFSLFRNNIVRTNLDSTRVMTPQQKASKKPHQNKVSTEPKATSKKNNSTGFKIPQTEFKNKRTDAVTRYRHPTNARWRELIDPDSDSDSHNITDDFDVDQTVMTDDSDEVISNASDSSWRKSEAEISSDDEKNTVQKRNNSKSKKITKSKNKEKNSSKDRLIYLDLSKNEVTILDDTPNSSPLANKDEYFKNRLSQMLDSCRFQDKPKMIGTPATSSTGKSKRRLFNVSYNENLDDSVTAICSGEIPSRKQLNFANADILEEVRFNGTAIPPSFNIFNKKLEAVKTGKPVFKITPTTTKCLRTPIATRREGTPFKNKEQHIYQTPTARDKRKLEDISATPTFKYTFLKSLDVCVGKSLCHPDALVFRENYRHKKEDLSKILYELYNSKIFDNNLIVPVNWNKKLSSTAGRCLNKKKLGKRFSVIELSDKVLTSADRLRCTLVHELCHAATWIFDGESGHGTTWKEWARKANAAFPDLPKIGVCHQYDIEYKYTYKCTLCAAKSYYHSKSKKVENIRCSYCHGAIEIFLNKKDKDGNIMPTPVREPTGFAKFVKEKYQQYKRPDIKHAEIMKMLSNEFAALKVAGNVK